MDYTTDEKTNIQNAKKFLKKQKLLAVILIVLAFLIYFGIACLINDVFIVIPCAIVFGFVCRLIIDALSRKMITGLVYSRLDAPLFYEVVKQGKIYSRDATWQIMAEYYIGNYENVIAICNRKLDEYAFEKYRFYYLAFLANCYFEVGDDEKLKEICEKFNTRLYFEKRRKKVISSFEVFKFYNAYLDRDLEACKQYLSKSPSIKISRVSLNFKKARFALLEGRTNEAKALFAQIVETSPNINFAELSKKALQAIEEGVDYSSAFEKLAESENVVIEKPKKLPKAYKIARVICAILFVVCLVFALIPRINTYVRQNNARKETQALIEQDYDGVKIIDLFLLEKDGEIVDSMFVAKTEDSILVGTTYVYDGDDTLYYCVQAERKFSYFSMAPCVKYDFYGVSSHWYVESYFYSEKPDVDENSYYSVSFNVDGKKCYFVITDIREEP